jgi:hypothetical protein
MRFLSNAGKYYWMLCVIGLVSSLNSVQVMATPKIKNNDQTMRIITDAQGCVTEVVLKSPIEDNCQDSEFADRCGKNGKDCVCILKSKFLSWEIDRNARFELQFVAENPLKSNCRLKSGSNKKIKCQIVSEDGDFKYNVVVESCPGIIYDPQIIVRH